MGNKSKPCCILLLLYWCGLKVVLLLFIQCSIDNVDDKKFELMSWLIIYYRRARDRSKVWVFDIAVFLARVFLLFYLWILIYIVV